MSHIAIQVDALSKRYRLGAGPQGQGDFRDAVRSVMRRLTKGRVNGSSDAARHDLWALDSISFEVRKGEVVGIIGHNGAGKSTLLKILSRITDPTSGSAWFEGRMGSLLEVGTGFHPELSGRENIFLSGAILGMTRKEIAAKLDEIVAFSEIGRFLDTPVKRYSSGMYVRLGFAVAAHLEPEVLIVDEVLAVGDAAFQRKCMAKMQRVSQEGRTILFVSHNMGSVQALCDRALVLKDGRLVSEGPPSEAAALYLRSTARHIACDVADRPDRRGRGRAQLVGIAVHNAGREATPATLIHGETAIIRCEVSEVLPDLACNITILNQLTQRVCRFSSRVAAPDDAVVNGKEFTCEIPELPLVPGQYHVNVAILAGGALEDSIDSAITFDVVHGSMQGRPLAQEQAGVVVAPRHRWLSPRARR
jgi:lipopolysaccharide transport system ATP-binding protein